MSTYSEVESLKNTITEALETGRSVRNGVEEKVEELNEIVSELDTINSELEDNHSALENLQENLDALDAQKDMADSYGIVV